MTINVGRKMSFIVFLRLDRLELQVLRKLTTFGLRSYQVFVQLIENDKEYNQEDGSLTLTEFLFDEKLRCCERARGRRRLRKRGRIFVVSDWIFRFLDGFLGCLPRHGLRLAFATTDQVCKLERVVVDVETSAGNYTPPKKEVKKWKRMSRGSRSSQPPTVVRANWTYEQEKTFMHILWQQFHVGNLADTNFATPIRTMIRAEFILEINTPYSID
ncbi:uncharacterized protein LOC127252501 [Andrographis paniculata]|uniref:uncharacterized protein LOC127252501 n=1 Tax=Andrographis paniculata TaxID=175694 RepID=UPI0021E79313|nr:uncharacterized protein LOC127252501 [Andrographis paniculata]